MHSRIALLALAGVALLSTPTLADIPNTTVPLHTRATNASNLLRDALQSVQSDATVAFTFDRDSGQCSRVNVTFNLPNPSHPQQQVQKAWFHYDAAVTRFEHAVTSGGKARSTLLPLPNTGGPAISLRFNGSTSYGQTASEVKLGEINGFPSLAIHNASKQMVSLCKETSENVKDIRAWLASSGYVTSSVNGRGGADSCSLKVSARAPASCPTCTPPPAVLRSMNLCAEPKIVNRRIQSSLAKPLGVPEGQTLPHLSCVTNDVNTLITAQHTEIPLRMLTAAQQEDLRKSLKFFATNQTRCGGQP